MSTVVCRVSCPAVRDAWTVLRGFAPSTYFHELTRRIHRPACLASWHLGMFKLFILERRHDDARTHARPSA